MRLGFSTQDTIQGIARLVDQRFGIMLVRVEIFKCDVAFVADFLEFIHDGGPVGRAIEERTEGWIAGMVIEAAMKGAGWPADAEKVRASMQNLKVDLKGLRGGPIEWTKENHFRTKQFYRVYRWDPAKNAIVIAKDWFSYDVK